MANGQIEEIHQGFTVLCRTGCGAREEFEAKDAPSFGNGLRQRGWITISGNWYCQGCESGSRFGQDGWGE